MIIVVAELEEITLLDETSWNNLDARVIVTGVGMMNTIRALENVSRDENILNIGYAGSNKLEKGKLYAVSKSSTHHSLAKFNEEPIELETKLFKDLENAPCYTAADFVTSTEIEEPALFDMELAAIAAMGFNKVMSIKKVSDTLNYQEYKEV